MFEKVSAMIDGLIESGQAPGNDTIICVDGKTAYRHTVGVRNWETGVPLTGKERYNIYSCSKLITCTAALQLWEKGLFTLDTPVKTFLPAFSDMVRYTPGGNVPVKTDITMRHLFTMTSGISYNYLSQEVAQAKKDTDGRCPTVRTMDYIAKMALSFEPGTAWQYGFSHDVLAAVVEVISGMKFETYVKKNVFDPLGMTNSTFMLQDPELDTLAEQYGSDRSVRDNVGKHILFFKLGTEYASGGAGCISSVDDYIRFLEAIRVGDVILRSDTVDLLSKNQLSAEILPTFRCFDSDGKGFGLGVRCPRADSESDEFGWSGMMGCYYAINRKLNYTMFFAMHDGYGKLDPTRVNIVKEIERELQK